MNSTKDGLRPCKVCHGQIALYVLLGVNMGEGNPLLISLDYKLTFPLKRALSGFIHTQFCLIGVINGLDREEIINFSGNYKN